MRKASKQSDREQSEETMVQQPKLPKHTKHERRILCWQVKDVDCNLQARGTNPATAITIPAALVCISEESLRACVRASTHGVVCGANLYARYDDCQPVGRQILLHYGVLWFRQQCQAQGS